MLIAYFVMGIITYILTAIWFVALDKDICRQPAFYRGVIIYMIFWPIFMGVLLYDVILEMEFEREEEE